MLTRDHFEEKNIIYELKTITFHNFVKSLILAYFERKKTMSTNSKSSVETIPFNDRYGGSVLNLEMTGSVGVVGAGRKTNKLRG